MDCLMTEDQLKVARALRTWSTLIEGFRSAAREEQKNLHYVLLVGDIRSGQCGITHDLDEHTTALKMTREIEDQLRKLEDGTTIPLNMSDIEKSEGSITLSDLKPKSRPSPR